MGQLAGLDFAQAHHRRLRAPAAVAGCDVAGHVLWALGAATPWLGVGRPGARVDGGSGAMELELLHAAPAGFAWFAAVDTNELDPSLTAPVLLKSPEFTLLLPTVLSKNLPDFRYNFLLTVCASACCKNKAKRQKTDSMYINLFMSYAYGTNKN